jgi:L-lactate dehydrogenase complex protein LldE
MSTVQLFHTCLVNEFFPAVGFAVVRVLEHLGFTISVPLQQTCCGQPAFNGGFRDEARDAARHTIETLEGAPGTVVIPSGSCADMLIHQYPVLFDADERWRTRAEAVAARCHEFSAFTATHLRGPLGKVQATVAYHPSCHLARGLGVDREPRALIGAIDGVDLRHVQADDECCGFGGLFAVKHGEISARMLDRKIGNVSASGAERLVSCDMGCLLHLGGGLRRRGVAMKVQHVAELAAEALE